MLNANKTITISGTSTIDGQIVVYMSASLSTDGTTQENINKVVQNQDLYNKNKEAIRKDMRNFEDAVYAEQDKLAAK
ncbi:Uncharacterised protein [[Clostridium] sordellii]|uniref:Uncharacterized protein n=1 Tax=Paraclostridium sordellii TaxID=1505 RepID=A0A0C7QUD5_PARSO|nr:hypothetical protein [Paeniclostridium sordellii]CEN74849.1 Uncharacterised protein [[Clostridium] sordellii] [Paeniclostridium sordellii]CEQ00340.1 Uncharacterised protein [[Clostridium] sordellii] [Paeniclostridium sordellii]CEQ01995.1 Uncharacterised protein [[Clostridium] sordellii] [Paeniclostridium sordellii]